MATLEFDRNRKSMSVIASASQPSSSSASGVTTRSSAKQGASNVLFVKGAAEYMLNRCSQVRNTMSGLPTTRNHSVCISYLWTTTVGCFNKRLLVTDVGDALLAVAWTMLLAACSAY